MSYNMNFGGATAAADDGFYSKRGDSRLEFADMSSPNQFYNPSTTAANAYNPGYGGAPAAAYDASQNSAGYYGDWATAGGQQMSSGGGIGGSFFTPSSNEEPFGMGGGGVPGAGGSSDFDSEPPLLEELGINFDHIYRKTKCVLNPFAKPHESIVHDEDLAGPLVFCIAYGFSLLLMGKIQFGYIYGITALGCLCMYMLLNLMSEKGVNAACIGSILGYCLLPMVILSFLSTLLSLDNTARLVLSLVFILWCSIASSKLFVHALSMANQQLLVLYPCFLVYGILALLNVF